MARLAVNVVLRNPKDDSPTVLLAGEELPKWAVKLVGEHCLEQDAPAGKRGRGRAAAKSTEPDGDSSGDGGDADAGE